MKVIIATLLAGQLAGCAMLPGRHPNVANGTGDINNTASVTKQSDATENCVPDVERHLVPQATGQNSIQANGPGWQSCLTNTDSEFTDGPSYPFVQRFPTTISGTVFDTETSKSTFGILPASTVLAIPEDPERQVGNSPIFVAVDPHTGAVKSVFIDDQPGCSKPHFRFSQVWDYPVVQNLIGDEQNFYSCPSLACLTVGLGSSAILANTNLDQEFRQAVHGGAGAGSNNLAWMTDLGNGYYVIPSLAGIWAVDYLIDSNSVGTDHPVAECLQEWSARSLRGMTVGAAPLVALQYLIGSSRPGQDPNGSHWDPFQSSHGVSGNAFIGAVPFWTAAQMTENLPLEAGFYALGTLGGIARIHTDSHYLSQVVMGWWLAGLSVAAVDCTELQHKQWMVSPTVFDDGAGITLVRQW